MKDEFEYKCDFLKFELGELQNSIRTFHGYLFIIKGWSITVFSGFILFAAKEHKVLYLIFCALSVVLFWGVESIHKMRVLLRIRTKPTRSG